MSKKSDNRRAIENFLRKYNTYKANIINCERQLNYLFPSVVASYEFEAKSGNSFMVSSTEKSAIDRIESKRAIDLHEEIARSKNVVESIDTAVESLDEKEREFVTYRYFKNYSVSETAKALKASERSTFIIRQQTIDKLLISLNNLLKF